MVLAAALLTTGCTDGSGGTRILPSAAGAGVPSAVTESLEGSASAVTESSAPGPPSSGPSPTATGGPSTAGSAASGATSAAGTTAVASSSAGICHDPDNPNLIYDCDAPPPHTFPGDHAAYVTAMTECMSKRGWHIRLSDTGIIAPPGLPARRAEQFNADAAACLGKVGLYSIANASDADITEAYRRLHRQWICLRDQDLPVKPFPTLKTVLAGFHRTHRLALDPLAGLADRDVGLSYCPSPQIPGLDQPPPTRLGH